MTETIEARALTAVPPEETSTETNDSETGRMTETPRKPRAIRSSPRGDARRRAILDSAVKLFSADGFHAATIAEIAAAVGITQAGLLHHFPSKRALLLAVLQDREERNIRDEEISRKSGLDYVSAFLHTLQVNEQKPALVQLFAVLSAESITKGHPAHAWFVKRYRRIVERATEALTEIIDADKLPPGTTIETVARWIIGAADGIRLQWLLDPGALSREETVAQLVEALRPYMRESAVAAAATREARRGCDPFRRIM